MSIDGSFTIGMLGSGGVGKTCVVLSFTQSKFDPEYFPTIQDFFEKNITVGEKSYNLKIIDTAGQAEMSGITDIAIKDAEGFIIVYSVTSDVTFSECEKIYQKVKQFAGASADRLVLCGNKCDLTSERVVTTERGQELAQKWGCPFFETSAKEMINITQVFQSIVKVLTGEWAAERKAKEEAGGKAAKKKKAESGGEGGGGGCCEIA